MVIYPWKWRENPVLPRFCNRISVSDEWRGRVRPVVGGAEGECKSSQAKGSGHDDAPKSAVFARRRCNLMAMPPGNLSGIRTEAQSICRGALCLFSFLNKLLCCHKKEGGSFHERTQTHPALRRPCAGRRHHGRFRGLGNAHPVSQRHCIRAPVYTSRLQPIRCVPHGPAAGGRTGPAGLFAACSHQQCGRAGPEHGTILHHPRPRRQRRG